MPINKHATLSTSLMEKRQPNIIEKISKWKRAKAINFPPSSIANDLQPLIVIICWYTFLLVGFCQAITCHDLSGGNLRNWFVRLPINENLCLHCLRFGVNRKCVFKWRFSQFAWRHWWHFVFINRFALDTWLCHSVTLNSANLPLSYVLSFKQFCVHVHNFLGIIYFVLFRKPCLLLLVFFAHSIRSVFFFVGNVTYLNVHLFIFNDTCENA